jgi:hypothetical protein
MDLDKIDLKNVKRLELKVFLEAQAMYDFVFNENVNKTKEKQELMMKMNRMPTQVRKVIHKVHYY